MTGFTVVTGFTGLIGFVQFLAVMFTSLETNVVPLFIDTCNIKALKKKARENQSCCHSFRSMQTIG